MAENNQQAQEVDTSLDQAPASNSIPDWKGFLDSGADVDLGVEEEPIIATDDVDDDIITDGTVDTSPPTLEEEEEDDAGINIDKFDPRTGDLIEKEKPELIDDEAEVYSSVANILKKQGFFAELEDIKTIKSAEELAAAFDKEVQARLTDRQKELLEYQNQGVPVTKVTKLQTALEEAKSIDVGVIQENPDLAKNLILSDLTYKGIDEATANKLYAMLEANNEVTTEAVKALEARKVNLSSMIDKEITEAKTLKQAELDRQKTEAEALEKQLSATEIFNRKVTPTTIEKIKKLAGTPVAYTKNGDPLNAVMKYRLDNPIDFEHKLLYLFAVTNGFENLNSFDRSAESRVSNTLRSAVTRMSAGQPITSNRVNSKSGTTINIDDIDDII